MAHDINKMIYVGEMPWHGLGVRLPARASYEVNVTIPAPAAALGCKIVPLPTPPNVLNYCCPCQN